ncbi:hypothetical protein A3J77_01045 [Candidatus Wolfebacteria bacterium RBG_13_41_7]|uniref:Uncharacterized protein n=1 Tax=Candidatus Wolfebacteria bacterium RBG_13_41_7 TaxID=1802554 RepID=A0A1F8DLT6_9BACT|nr:MAG: hypothetical protein A3J77_01045 [Candidatus Wolfebacteria bacterium RBG_13_41_7]
MGGQNKMNKKMLIFVIIFLALLVAAFAYNYFTKPIVNAPTINSENQSNGSFHGPIGAPSIKGPSSPPPTD